MSTLFGSLNRDVVLLIVGHLNIQDILSVSLGNWTLYSQLFSYEAIWYKYVIDTAADTSWHGIKQGDISWKDLVQMVRMRIPSELRKEQTPIQLSMELRKIHLRRRFEAPPSSKDFLRLYLEVKTNNPKIPTILVPGTEVPYLDLDELKANKSEMTFVFNPKEGGSFLSWAGEGGNDTYITYYCIDRHTTPNPRLDISTNIVIYTKSWKSTLGKKDYAFVGQVLHGDPHFYEGMSSSKYNWDTSHSYHRSGNAPTGMASSTRGVDKPDLRIDCITRVVVTYSVNALYNVFIKGIKQENLKKEHYNVISDNE